MSKVTYEQIAEDFKLWREHFDINGMMNEKEFAALSIEVKVKLQADEAGVEIRAGDAFI